MKKLARTLEQTASAASDVDEATLRKWKADVAALFKEIDKWLQPLVAKRLVSVDREVVPIAEPDLGAYDAPALALRFRTRDPRLVRIVPRAEHVVGIVRAGGERVIGFRGRVDVKCGPNVWALLRHGSASWSIVPIGDGPKKRPLTEETFAVALRSLLDAVDG